jgi:hypothetical protein
MEIEVTHMVEDKDEMVELSGSCLEHGQDAGRITWDNSKAYGAERPLLATEEERDAARAYFREYGAWDAEEIEAWPEEELQAIMVQDVAAAIREMDVAETYEEYQKLCDDGVCSSRLYKGADGKWLFYLGM